MLRPADWGRHEDRTPGSRSLGQEKSQPEVIKLGLDLHARQVTECRQLDASTPKPAQKMGSVEVVGSSPTVGRGRDKGLQLL